MPQVVFILNVVVPQVPGQFFGLAGTVCVLFFEFANALLIVRLKYSKYSTLLQATSQHTSFSLMCFGMFTSIMA